MRKFPRFVAHKYLPRKLAMVSIGFMFTTLAVLHVVILPHASGAYNKPCYLSAEQLEDLRYMVRNIITIYEDMNVTYWLDFGTLLGAVRTGDILRHDGDADIGRTAPEGGTYNLGEFMKRLSKKGIESNRVIAWYKNLTVDLHRWEQYDGEVNGKSEKMLRRKFSERILKEQSFIDKAYEKTLNFPSSWILPTKEIDFLGMKARIPSNHDSLLKHHYPFTYFRAFSITVPYKWKCWVPLLH